MPIPGPYAILMSGMRELDTIVLAFRDPVLAGQARRALMAQCACPVERFEDWASAEGRVREGGVSLVVAGPGLADIRTIDGAVSAGLREGGCSVLVISDEEGWSGDIAVLPTGYTPGELSQALEGILNMRQRMGRDEYIRQMAPHVVPAEALQEAELREDGSWHRRVDGGLVEVGVDIRRWVEQGRMLCVEHMENEELVAGKPFARLLVGDGSAHTLYSPVSGRVRERNEEANGAVCVLAPRCASEGWTLWLLRVETS